MLVISLALYLLSAGIGRTGCFIASSIGCQQLRETEQVDILETVCQLRLDRLVTALLLMSSTWFYAQTSNWVGLPHLLCRGGMIQTTEQYQFLYSTLAQYSSQLHHREVHWQLKLQRSENFYFVLYQKFWYLSWLTGSNSVIENVKLLFVPFHSSQLWWKRFLENGLGGPLVTKSVLFPSTRRRNSQTLSAYSFRTFIWTVSTEHRTQRAARPGTKPREVRWSQHHRTRGWHKGFTQTNYREDFKKISQWQRNLRCFGRVWYSCKE